MPGPSIEIKPDQDLVPPRTPLLSVRNLKKYFPITNSFGRVTGYVKAVDGVSNGYDVPFLKEEVKKILELGTDSSLGGCEDINPKKICIVGLGRLGAALLDEEIFHKSGFEVCAGFDSSLNKVELMRSTFELYPASRIESVIPQQKIEYAILCCAENEAQKMADRLVKAGIKGIVNYTRAVVRIPTEVKIENVSPVLALQIVS